MNVLKVLFDNPIDIEDIGKIYIPRFIVRDANLGMKGFNPL